jgi:hypothetical protein
MDVNSRRSRVVKQCINVSTVKMLHYANLALRQVDTCGIPLFVNTANKRNGVSAKIEN